MPTQTLAPDALDQQLQRDLYAYEQIEQELRDPAPGPSDVAVLHPPAGCRRRLAYRVQGAEPTDPVPAWLVRSAIMGKAVHLVAAQARRELHPDWLVEEPVTVPGFDRPGQLDAYDPASGTVDDVKSKSDHAYRAVLERGQAAAHERDQVLLYGLALEAGQPGLQVAVKRCSVTYVNRSTGDQFVDSWTYDRAAAEQVALAMYGVLDLVESRPADDIPRDGRNPAWKPCDSCPFRRRCWDLPADATDRDIELTVSTRATPAEVVEAAVTLQQLRAEGRENKAGQDWCKAVLAGHGGARFTDPDGIERTVRWSKSKPAGEGGHIDTEAVRARYELLGEPVPTLGTASRLSFPAVP